MTIPREAASERTWDLTDDDSSRNLNPLPCRYSSLESLLAATDEAGQARARAEAAPQTLLPFTRQ